MTTGKTKALTVWTFGQILSKSYEVDVCEQWMMIQREAEPLSLTETLFHYSLHIMGLPAGLAVLLDDKPLRAKVFLLQLWFP